MSPCRSRWPARCPHQAGPSGYCPSHRTAHQRAHQLPANGYTQPRKLRTYLTTWTTRGRRLTTLARLAHVSPRVLFDVHARRLHWVRPGVTETVCAIPLPPSDIGCMRRLQALAVRGHTLAHTATGIGPTTTHAALVKAFEIQRFPDTLADAIATYYPHAILRPGPSKLMTHRAHEKGYQHPNAWLDRDIDDPNTTPNPHWWGPEPLTLNNAWHRAMELQGLSVAWLRTQGLDVREAA